jgi:hypothetical protein
MLQSLFYLTITLHVSGIIITIETDNNKGMYILYFSTEHIAFSAEYISSTTIVILI